MDEAPIETPDLGRYHLLAKIAAGGMGDVFVAHDVQLDREVVVKRLQPPLDAPSVNRFVREARIQGRLDHPSIVPVHEVGHDARGYPYFVMKHLVGRTLHEVLHESDGASPGETWTRRRLLDAFVAVCMAIEQAHERGVIHRDLKPSNIMLGAIGETYVIDWGVARELTADEMAGGRPPVPDEYATMAGTSVGSPGYMSPEQVAAVPIDGRADVYGLGCILFELLTGKRLNAIAADGRWQPRGGDDARPSRYGHDVAPELDDAIAGATQLDRGDRTPSARALGAQLQRFLDGDRDVEQRAALAAARTHEAHLALAQPGDEVSRAHAMRLAGQALALDPTNDTAAAMVGQLMLSPPAVIPLEVEADLARAEAADAARHTRVVGLGFLAFLVFVPLMYGIGVRSGWWVLGVGTMLLVNALVFYAHSRSGEVTGKYTYATMVAYALMIGMLGLALGPFFISPAIAAVMAMSMASHPRFGRAWILAAISSAGVLAPWLAEQAGWLSTSTLVIDGGLVTLPRAFDLVAGRTEATMAVFVVTLLVTATLASRRLAHIQREVRLAQALQAWHLRQVVRPPTPPTPIAATPRAR